MKPSTTAWVAGVVVALIPSVAMADFVVVNSTDPVIKAGKVIANGAAMSIAAGAKAVLISATGKTISVDGPFSGVPAPADEGHDEQGLTKSLASLFTGGTETTSLGVTRSALTPPHPNDPWQIAAGKAGPHCVKSGGKAEFWRAKSAKRGALMLTPDGGNKAVVGWPVGKKTLAWPSAVPLTDGATYGVRSKRGGTVKITVHVAPQDLKDGAFSAAWMADKGCRDQALRLLAGLN